MKNASLMLNKRTHQKTKQNAQKTRGVQKQKMLHRLATNGIIFEKAHLHSYLKMIVDQTTPDRGRPDQDPWLPGQKAVIGC